MMDKERDEADALKTIIDRLNADEKERKNRAKGWISVAYALPETEDNVFLHSINSGNPPKKAIEIGRYSGSIWENYIGKNIEDGGWRVTHWMPLDKLVPEV